MLLLCLWSTLYVAVSKCMLFLFYLFLILFGNYLLKDNAQKSLFWKFQVLRESTNVVGFFPEHPLYSNFEMFSVLILGILFWFVVNYAKSMCKSNLFFVSLGAPLRKKRYCFFRGAPCIDHFQNAPDISIHFKFFYFDLPLLTQI